MFVFNIYKVYVVKLKKCNALYYCRNVCTFQSIILKDNCKQTL